MIVAFSHPIGLLCRSHLAAAVVYLYGYCRSPNFGGRHPQSLGLRAGPMGCLLYQKRRPARCQGKKSTASPRSSFFKKKMVSRAARAKPNERRPPSMAGLERGVFSPCQLEISFSMLFVNRCVMWPRLRTAFPRGAPTLEIRHRTRAVVIKTGSQSADYERVSWSPSLPAPLEAGGTAGDVLIDQFLGNLGSNCSHSAQHLQRTSFFTLVIL